MNQTAMYINIMKESLERKLGYLKELLSLTEKQTEIANKEKFDENSFDYVMEKKDVLINNINEIDKGFTAVYDRVRTDVLADKELYKAELIAIQNLIRKCVDTGMQIEVTEERNRAVLEQAFSAGFKGVRQAKQSKQAVNKYYKSMANGMINDSMLYDRKK